MRRIECWRAAALIVWLLASVSCSTESIVVVPDSRTLTETRPGYYEISAGYLREIMRALERCGEHSARVGASTALATGARCPAGRAVPPEPGSGGGPLIRRDASDVGRLASCVTRRASGEGWIPACAGMTEEETDDGRASSAGRTAGDALRGLVHP